VFGDWHQAGPTQLSARLNPSLLWSLYKRHIKLSIEKSYSLFICDKGQQFTETDTWPDQLRYALAFIISDKGQQFSETDTWPDQLRYALAYSSVTKDNSFLRLTPCRIFQIGERFQEDEQVVKGFFITDKLWHLRQKIINFFGRSKATFTLAIYLGKCVFNVCYLCPWKWPDSDILIWCVFQRSG